MAKKIHIPRSIFEITDPTDRSLTMCGRLISELGEGQLIQNGKISDATCFVCLGSDDRRQVDTHRRECRDAKIDPNTLEPIHRGHD